jgi:hypothetical protein
VGTCRTRGTWLPIRTPSGEVVGDIGGDAIKRCLLPTGRQLIQSFQDHDKPQMETYGVPVVRTDQPLSKVITLRFKGFT